MLSAEKDTNWIQNSQTIYRRAFASGTCDNLKMLFKKLGKKKLDATMQHVKEEGENLKRIIESS